MDYKALVLDQTYYPIQIVDWKDAMRLFFSGRAEVVEHHEQSNIRSPRASYKVPKVLRVFQKVFAPRDVRFNRFNVFLRDDYTCQYCSFKGLHTELTLDHVFPKSRGGKTHWDNIVTCCFTCNNKKADRTPAECSMRLKKTPKKPHWGPLWGVRLNDHEAQWWRDWIRHK